MPLAWLPYRDRADAESHLGRIPDTVEVDFYRDGGRTAPDTTAEVEFLVLPFAPGHQVLDHVRQMSKLRVVQAVSAGFEEYLPLVPEQVTFCNAAGVHDAGVSEMAVALTLASLRRVDDAVRNMARAEWKQQPTASLAGATVMIVGYGRIGRAIEVRLRGFDPADIIRVSQRAEPGPPQVHAAEELSDLLPDADVVILVAPSTERTHHMIGRRELGLMCDGSALVNVGRGALIDTDALVHVLRTGRIRAALDVEETEPLPADHPLWQEPDVIITPHAAGLSSTSFAHLDQLIHDQLERFAAGRPLHNVVTHGAFTASD